MNALDALRMARDAGVRVWIDGDDLVVEAVAAPPPKVIGLLSSHKVEILRQLRGAANDTVPAASRPSQSLDEVFQFNPPGDPASDDDALQERVAIMAVENGWNEDRALQEARWTLDRERCWRAFLRNAERVLAAPGAKHGAMISIYQVEAIRRYGERTGTDMALSLASWVRARGVH